MVQLCYLKDTKRFDERIIWNTNCFLSFFFFCICYYYIILIIIVLYFIASWRWFLIFTNPESTFFGLSSLEFFIESLYTSYYIYIKFFFLLPFFIFIYAYISVCSYVFTCTGLAEKRVRFPYGLRVLFCTYILEIFIFVLLNCESL